jgi:hypothetical protein
VARGCRLVCYCDDCQAYACFLAQRGEGILDGAGGTDIFQTCPGAVQLEAGHGELRCVRLTDKGLHRWYTACCRTPVGNTLGAASFPFVGLVHAFLDVPEARRDELLGAPLARVQRRFAHGPVPGGAKEPLPLGYLARFARLVARGYVRGLARPSPFFVAGRPVRTPEVLPPGERAALGRAVAALAS